MRELFRRFAHAIANAVGTPAAFMLAALTIVAWAVTGPVFGFSDTWQLVINTATTIVTFLMVFLIQNAQNRDARALHLKLDELIRAVKGARTRLVNLEEFTDEELDHLHAEFEALRDRRKTPGAEGATHAIEEERHRRRGSRKPPSSREKESR
jgi:low affinity Fe/Cu permease